MRTIIIIAGGFFLLLVLVFGGKIMSQNNKTTMAKAALLFVPVWFLAAGYNMWVGVSHAGYSVAEEAPIFAIIFGLPAAIALYLWSKFSKA